MKAALVSSASSTRTPIRLILDGRKLGDGGIGVYTANLIAGLVDVGGVDVSVIVRSVDQILPAFSRNVTWIKDSAKPYSIDELIGMPRRVPFSDFDIFHAPHFVLPYRVGIPTVVTVHDLIQISHPEKFYYPWVARRLIGSSVRRADAVIAVSRHTRSEVLNLADVSESKVTYIPNAIAPEIVEKSERIEGGHREHPYLFVVMSNNKPHKGLKDLLQAYRMYREGEAWKSSLSACPRLIVAGYGAENIERALLDQDCAHLLQGVSIDGVLSPKNLRQRLSHALALVVPSLVEGFCLPALEAQSCGTPVICRPVPALRELVTEHDTVASDFSVESLAKAIAQGISRGVSGRRQVVQAHIDRFSCAVVGAQVKSEYQKVLANGRAR